MKNYTSVLALLLIGAPLAADTVKQELVDQELKDRESEHLIEQHDEAVDVESIQVILNAFSQMLVSFANSMANLDNPVVAATSMGSIATNFFRVILELAKQKTVHFDLYNLDPLDRTRNNLQCSLEAMEQELIHNCKDSRDEKTSMILNEVANMIGELGDIIEDPHNPHNVGSSVANMIAGIFHIAATATRNGPLDEDATLDDLYAILNITPETHTQFHEYIYKEILRARLLQLHSLVGNNE